MDPDDISKLIMVAIVMAGLVGIVWGFMWGVAQCIKAASDEPIYKCHAHEESE